MNIQKPVIRSSSTPMLMTCTNSIINPDGLQRVENENETALLGTLVHELCRKLVDTGSYDLAELRQRLSVEDFDRASVLFGNFLTVWRAASVHMLWPVTEQGFTVELSHAILTGHIDVQHVEPARAFILDYKTGRVHEDHYHQMASYAYGVWAKAGKPKPYVVYVTSVYLEDNSVKPYEFTAPQLEEWEQEVSTQLLQQRYTAGRKCSHCTLQDTCPAYAVYGANARRFLLDSGENLPAPTWEAMTPEDRGQIADAMYVLEKAIDRAKLGLRNLVKSRGAVDVGSGKEYVLVEQEERQVNFKLALPVLQKLIGKDGVERNSRVPLDAVLTEAAARAPKGKKTLARKEALAALEKAGAIVRSKTTRMWKRPKGETTLEDSQ